MAVLDRTVGERALRPRDVLSGSAAEALRAYVRGFFAFHTANPFFHRLLIEEIAQSESAAAREAFHRLNHMAIAGLRDILEEGARDGTLNEADPVLLHVAIVGMCEFFFASGVLLEDALGKGMAPHDVADRYGELVATLVLNGIGRK